MKCFSCNCQVFEKKSQYGFYYQCPKCGKIFETTGQTTYNSNNYTNRKDSNK